MGRQERGFSSGEKCPETPYAGHPLNLTGQHRVPGSHEIFGGLAPHQGVTPGASYGSCQPESCQERLLLAPRQRKVTRVANHRFRKISAPAGTITRKIR